MVAVRPGCVLLVLVVVEAWAVVLPVGVHLVDVVAIQVPLVVMELVVLALVDLAVLEVVDVGEVDVVAGGVEEEDVAVE